MIFKLIHVYCCLSSKWICSLLRSFTSRIFLWLDSIIFWRIKINISYQFWADDLSKNVRSAALYGGVDLSKKRKAGLYFRPYECAAKNWQNKKQAATMDSISKTLSIKAPFRGCLQLQNFVQTLMTHISIQKTRCHNIWRILRIGDSD